MQFVEVDGSIGEGGGQVLRTALTLSSLLQKPFKISGIRSGRKVPGLLAQHLTCVKAAAQVSAAKVAGDILGSTQLTFEPSRPKPGSYEFDCGTAGSTTLVAQTLLPVLALLPTPSSFKVTGGTETSFAPTSFYFRKVFLPLLARFGVEAEAGSDLLGWYPRGGGRLSVSVQPCRKILPIKMPRRQPLQDVWGISIVSNLPRDIAGRAKSRALKNLSEAGIKSRVKIDLLDAPAVGEGMEFFLGSSYEGGAVAGFSSLGERGKPADKVAGEAVHSFLQFEASTACIDPHAADQLLLYCALAQGDSEYTCPSATGHLKTNAQVISSFLPGARISIEEKEACRVKVAGAGVSGHH